MYGAVNAGAGVLATVNAAAIDAAKLAPDLDATVASNAVVGADSAQNIANAQRLAQQLRLESANSPFTTGGTLTQDAINNATQIMAPKELTNPAIPTGSRSTRPVPIKVLRVTSKCTSI